MGKKLDMILGGVELLVGIGVSALVGSALVLVKPAKLGAIKKIAVGVGGFAISCMAVDGVTDYVDKQVKETVQTFKDVFKKKEPEIKVEATVEETVEGDEA